MARIGIVTGKEFGFHGPGVYQPLDSTVWTARYYAPNGHVRIFAPGARICDAPSVYAEDDGIWSLRVPSGESSIETSALCELHPQQDLSDSKSLTKYHVISVVIGNLPLDQFAGVFREIEGDLRGLKWGWIVEVGRWDVAAKALWEQAISAQDALKMLKPS